MDPKEFQKQVDDQRVVEAIVTAEKQTSGEIRVFIRQGPCNDPLAAAHRELEERGMKKTPLRNAVLIYIVPASRQFAIAADEGIHLRCGEAFWTSIAADMSELLKQGKFTEALLAGIQRAGAELAKHFPKHPNDRDDLPNSILRE